MGKKDISCLLSLPAISVFILSTSSIDCVILRNNIISSFDCVAAVAGPSLAKWISRGDQLSHKQSQEFCSSIIEWGALSTNCLKPQSLRRNLNPCAHLTDKLPAHTGSSIRGWCCNTSQSLAASSDAYWEQKILTLNDQIENGYFVIWIVQSF